MSILDQHEKIALSFSGGKDSLACVYLFRERLDRITLYHVDTGDLLPEVREVVDFVEGFAPNFVRINTDVGTSIRQHGLPTDLLPSSAHWLGDVMGEGKTKLVPRYDCCYRSLMKPVLDRVLADGNTLLIRGTKRIDTKRMATEDGDQALGLTIHLPLQEWSNEQVFAYLREQGAPICRVYETMTNAPECARCSAWWHEGRAAYLRKHHPSLWADYRDRLRAVTAEIGPLLESLQTEVAGCLETPEGFLTVPTAPALPYSVLEQTSKQGWDMGLRVLEGNRLGPNDVTHVRALLHRMGPSHGARILDIGSGFGEVARLMKQERPDMQFTLLNRSRVQLDLSPPEFPHYHADMHAIPPELIGFDGAMMLYSMCFSDLSISLREAHRAVKPGGFLFIYDYVRNRGRNDLAEKTLFARFHTERVQRKAFTAAGWKVRLVAFPGGDDSLFRKLLGDDAKYEAIFGDLTPVIWKLTTDA